MPVQPSYNPYAADQQPNLSLADTPDVASGYGVTVMPTSMPPIPRPEPGLSCSDPVDDMINLGIDPGVYFFRLNLAGRDPLPNPPYTDDARAIAPVTSTASDFSIPPFQANMDLVDGIDWRPPFGIDPLVPDLSHYVQPKGLAAIIAASSDPMAIDPDVPDLSVYDRPSNLEMPGPLMVDPALPDLKYPTLEPEIMMPDRPGELHPSAMSIMHSDPTERQVPASSYEELWMTQTGNNSRRERHIGMLDLGLDREEAGR